MARVFIKDEGLSSEEETTSKIIVKNAVKRKPGYLYYIDARGDLCEAKLDRGSTEIDNKKIENYEEDNNENKVNLTEEMPKNQKPSKKWIWWLIIGIFLLSIEGLRFLGFLTLFVLMIWAISNSKK